MLPKITKIITTNKMEIERNTKMPLVEQMKTLEVGDVLLCQPDESFKAAAYASRYGFMWSRRFSTHKDVERRVYIITREE